MCRKIPVELLNDQFGMLFGKIPAGAPKQYANQQKDSKQRQRKTGIERSKHWGFPGAQSASL
jgi:hypothetical protein